MNRVLIVGCPRSSTTWVSSALGQAAGAVVVQEPDNPDAHCPARHAQRRHGMYPIIRATDSASDYKHNWDYAWAGGWPTSGLSHSVGRGLRTLLPDTLARGLERATAPILPIFRRTPSCVIAKSVMCAFSLSWIVARYAPRVVLVERDALDVVSSWLVMNTPLGNLLSEPMAEHCRRHNLPSAPLSSDRVSQCAWAVGLLTTALRVSVSNVDGALIVQHADLIVNTQAKFMSLFAELGLNWTRQASAFLDRSSVRGEGYSTLRAPDQLRNASARRMDALALSSARRELGRFGLTWGDRPASLSTDRD